MNRIELHIEPRDLPAFRAELEEKGFKLDPRRSVERTGAHPPSREEYFEERYQHPDGNIVRLFPHTIVANGPEKGSELTLAIEFKPEEAPCPSTTPSPTTSTTSTEPKVDSSPPSEELSREPSGD